MAKKGFALCGACAELTPSAGGFCRLCRTPLIQPKPAEDEGHCPACGTLVKLTDEVCYGCGWRLVIPKPVVVMIAIAMAALTFLSAAGSLALWNRWRVSAAANAPAPISSPVDDPAP